MLTSRMEEWCGILTSRKEEQRHRVLTSGKDMAAAVRNPQQLCLHVYDLLTAHGGNVAANLKVGRSIYMKLMVCGRRRDRFFPAVFLAGFTLTWLRLASFQKREYPLRKSPHKTGLQASLQGTRSWGITVANLIMCFGEDCGGF